MSRVTANGIELTYESIGDAERPAVLLIMGLGMQMTAWPQPFCDALVAAGYRVIRFDNRDIGLSGKLVQAARPNLAIAAMRYWLRLPVAAPYRLDAMTEDSIALLDALGIAAAHIVGVSMGGMIAQLIAARHPQRCLSLTSIMSSSGDRSLPRPDLVVLRMLIARPPKSAAFDRLVAHFVQLYRAIGSPQFPTSDAVLHDRISHSLRRSYYPAGTARQLLAIVASGNRNADLAQIRVPTLIVHGDGDPLVPLAHGIDCARRIKGADLQVIVGMGHDLPDALLPRLSDLLIAHWRRAAAL